MSGTNGTDILNPDATATESNYEVCQRTGFRVPRGTLLLEWTGLWVCPEVWEARHPNERDRGRSHERAHEPGNPEPDDVFVGTVTASDL